jgi:MFS family permease
MPLTRYRRVLSVPGVRPLTALGVVARLPHTATSLVLTVHVTQVLGRGYGVAGLVVAAWTVGMALGAPWQGRAVDRFGLRWALLPSLVTEAAVWGSAPRLPLHWLLAAVVLGGALALPVFTVTRLGLSVLVPPAERRTAFALDSVAVEVSFMVGPALGVLVATRASTQVAMVGLGLLAVLAGIGLMALDPPTRAPVSSDGSPNDSARDEPAPDHRTPARVLVSPAVLTVLGASVGATVVLAGTEVSIIAALRDAGELPWTGLVTAAWAGASLLGGLAYGALARSIQPFLLLLVLGALTIPVGLSGHPLALGLAMLPAGFLCAPAITATAEVITGLVPDRMRGEAMGWHGSALTAGTAAGAPLAGFAADHVAPWAGFAAVGLAGVVLAAVGLAVLAARRPSGLSSHPRAEVLLS